MPRTRRETLDALEAHPDVPVLILGAGVNGCGLFRELALQGVQCLLVDKADFVAGASSKSSRMIHGGLRYLENRELRLVRESLHERNRLLENAPHTVAPQRTTIPLFSWLGGLVRSALVFLGLPVRPGGRGALVVKLGLAFYDFVTRRDRRTPRHFFTSRKASLQELPGLNPRIVATATYWDASISQAERLCIELVQDAQAACPACQALNHTRPVAAEGPAVRLRDETCGREVAVRPQVVVNATGAWVDQANGALGLDTALIGGTKGSHLVVDCPELHRTLGDRMVYYEHADGRICIAFPFGDKVIMGSTDIRVDDPEAARCESDEIEYMLATLRGVFPGLEVRPEQIVATFCGVRPLPAVPSRVTATIPRGHRLHPFEPEGPRPFPVLCLVGGKWTTFRAFAEQVADDVLGRLGRPRQVRTEHVPIGGGKSCPRSEEERAAWVARVAEEAGVPAERARVLLERYGTAAAAYLAEADARAERPLDSLPDYTVGEIERIAAREWVVHLTDLVWRRSTIALLGKATPAALEELAAVAGQALGWDAARRAAEVEAARAELSVAGR